MGDYEKMWEEEAGVMRNAMTTIAPGGAKNSKETLFKIQFYIEKHVSQLF